MPVSALMDGVEPVVPVMLLDVVLPGAAVPAMTWIARSVASRHHCAANSWPPASDVEQQGGFVAFGGRFSGVLQVDQPCAVQTQRQAA